jgi:hypothetical protein
MRTTRLSWMATLAVAACLTGSAARADDGVVRISDGAIPGPGCATGGCEIGVGPDGACGPVCQHAGCGEPCDDDDRCRGCGLLSCLKHRHMAGAHDHCCPLTAMLCGDACTHSPDWGWNRPRHYPIHRVPVTYHRFWPTKWYGEPGSAFIAAYPMVYQPTDTTELGFYYQRVPYWTPKPWMLPPGPPFPPQWHHRDCYGPYDAALVD